MKDQMPRKDARIAPAAALPGPVAPDRAEDATDRPYRSRTQAADWMARHLTEETPR